MKNRKLAVAFIFSVDTRQLLRRSRRTKPNAGEATKKNRSRRDYRRFQALI
jgi:hypothetical protein